MCQIICGVFLIDILVLGHRVVCDAVRMLEHMKKNNNIIDVEVIDRILYKNEYYFLVQFDGEKYLSKCFSWQLLKEYEIPPKIKCFSESHNVEENILIQAGGNHLQHPHYVLDLVYSFRLLDFSRINPSTNEFKLIIRGKDNFNYSINYFKSRFDEFSIDEEIECKFKGISINGDLKFMPKRTFIPIEDIISCPQQAKSTFYSLLKSNQELTLRLHREYENEENTYILTYCNLLKVKIDDLLENLSFKEANTFNQSLILVENWVLHSGFLTTFNEENRKNAKKKAEYLLKDATNLVKVISIIESFKYEEFLNNLITKETELTDEEVDIVYKLFKYSPPHNINYSLFINTIYFLGAKGIFCNPNNKRFISLIYKRKKELRKEIYENPDSIVEGSINFLYDKELLGKLLPLTYCEAVICKELSLEDDFLLSRTSFFKQVAYFIDNSKVKIEYLKLAIQLSNNKILDSDNLVFNWEQRKFNKKTIESFLSQYKILNTNENIYEKICTKLSERQLLKTTIVAKFETGFQLNYYGVFGIILFKEIKDSFKYKIGDTLEVYIISYNHFTHEFLGTTIKKTLDYYLNTENSLIWEKFWNSSNLFLEMKNEQYNNIKIGDILEGKVKSIKEYGAFIDLGFIDALLHKDELKWGFISSVQDVVKKNQKIKVKVIEKNDIDQKINVSLKQMTVDPKININKIKIGQKYKCTIYKETQSGFIIELDNGLTAFLNRKYLNQNQLNIIDSKKFVKNALSVTVNKIDKKKQRIFTEEPVFLEIEIKKNGNIEFSEIPLLDESVLDNNQTLRNISFEKAFIIESYAHSISDIKKKIDLFEWVKLYTILYPTRKKFLIELYIFFYQALYLFYSKKSISDVKSFFKNLFNENDFSKTIVAFPHAKKFINILEILSLFGVTSNKSISTLYQIIIEENSDQLILKLSKLLLSTNLMYSLTEEERYLKLSQTQIYKYLQSGALSFQLSFDEADKELIEEQRITKMINGGETDTMEFKSTLLFDVKNNKPNRSLEKEVLKTIAAFLNTKGGTLLIGVEDSGDIYGLENDFKNVPGSAQNPKDKFLLYMDSLINNYLGKEFNTLIEISFHQMHREEICQVDVRPSKEPVFLTYKKNPEEFYIRNNAQSIRLNFREFSRYLSERKQ